MSPGDEDGGGPNAGRANSVPRAALNLRLGSARAARARQTGIECASWVVVFGVQQAQRRDGARADKSSAPMQDPRRVASHKRKAHSPPTPSHTHQDPVIKGDVSKVAVLILDAGGAAVERFVASLAVRPEILASVEPADVEAALRSALLKLRFVDGALAPLPPHCTFEVVAAANGRGALPGGEWGDASAAAAPRPPRGVEAPRSPPRGVLPLKSADAGGGALKLNVFVETAA